MTFRYEHPNLDQHLLLATLSEKTSQPHSQGLSSQWRKGWESMGTRLTTSIPNLLIWVFPRPTRAHRYQTGTLWDGKFANVGNFAKTSSKWYTLYSFVQLRIHWPLMVFMAGAKQRLEMTEGASFPIDSLLLENPCASMSSSHAQGHRQPLTCVTFFFSFFAFSKDFRV